MQEQQIEILNNCRCLFQKFGIKSLTMAEIAKRLGISTKTLYKHVNDKNDLVHRSLEQHFSNFIQYFANVKAQTELNAIDQMLSSSKYLLDMLSDFNPTFFYDLEKYHPKAYALKDAFLEGYVKNMVLENIEKGKQEGLYRENLNSAFVFELYRLNFEHILLNHFSSIIKTMSVKEAYLQYFEYHIKGVASIKGHQYLNSIKNQILL